MSTTEGVFPPTGIVPNPEMGMELTPSHDAELSHRLDVLQTAENSDPVHAKLQGSTAVLFIVVVLGIAVVSMIGALL